MPSGQPRASRDYCIPLCSVPEHVQEPTRGQAHPGPTNSAEPRAAAPDMASTSVSEEPEEYVDALGVITALERTCELEARLRQAIQDTHPLTTTLDWDFNAADKEREGLLAIRCGRQGRCSSPAGARRRVVVRCWRRRRGARRVPCSALQPMLLCLLARACSEQLEYLEDKLREYRFLEPSEVDHQVGAGRKSAAWHGSQAAVGSCSPAARLVPLPGLGQACLLKPVFLGACASARRIPSCLCSP